MKKYVYLLILLIDYKLITTSVDIFYSFKIFIIDKGVYSKSIIIIVFIIIKFFFWIFFIL